MSPDKVADALGRLGSLAHVWVEADHGHWTVTLVWGGQGAFIGRGDDFEDAYRNMLAGVIKTGHSVAGLHDLAASVLPGIVGLPAKCHTCPVMERWQAERLEQVDTPRATAGLD